MKRLPILPILFLITFTACDLFESPTDPSARATLSGRVTMAGSGRPHYPSSVAVVAGRPDFRYDSVDTEGRYRITGLEPGRYVLVLTLGQGAGTREGLREPIEITPGENVKDLVAP